MKPYINFHIWRLKPSEAGGVNMEGIAGTCYEEHANILRDIVAKDSGAGCAIIVVAGSVISAVRGTGKDKEADIP